MGGLNAYTYKTICHKFGFNEDCVINPNNVKAYVLKRREDGSTEIVLQNINEGGIPFTSFYEVIDNDLESTYAINKALEE